MKNGIHSIFKMLGILIIAYLVIAIPALVYTGDISLPGRNSQDSQVSFKDIQERNPSENIDVPAEKQTLNPESSAVEYYNRTYTWEYGGSSQNYQIEIPKEMYDYYKNQSHSSQGFTKYALTNKDRTVLNEIIFDFEKYGESRNYTDYQNVMNLIAFIQAMPYTSDILTTGYEEYPRYPIETLVDNGGDCEDSVILAAALLSEMGYGTVLLEFKGHLALGVDGGENFNGAHYEYKGRKYYYVETTVPGYGIGDVPDDVDAREAKIHPMK